MRIIKEWLLATKKIGALGKQAAIWNAVASAEYSLQSVILLLVVTRMGGMIQAGIFTITYTVAQMMATIGSYSMRDFQASDISRRYSFADYWTSRIITVSAMLFICVGYSLIGKYSVYEIALILSFSIYRTVDDLEDVIHGEMQREFRLDVAAKIMSIRIFVATTVFIVVYIFQKNLLYSALSMAIVAMILEIILTQLVFSSFEAIHFEVRVNRVKTLLITCFPLCAGGFLYNYLVNATKYAINRTLTESYQTIFGILFMPIFAINMLSIFIYKPSIANMGQLWSNGDKEQFLKKILRQVGLILVLTIIVVTGGYFIGLDLLGWIYGVDLAHYRSLFAVLLLFGGISALNAYFVVVLTIMRLQKIVIISYGVAALFNIVAVDYMVLSFKLWGAGVMYGSTMTLVLCMFGICTILSVRKSTIIK